ncbi:MAG: hypothetical protein A3G34_16920 [Candidatus Lindowbacteria bacterium RIFCSPLOWO2_12_FULL_62_27]|nr:MAG: hypothetical protein A3I06_02195 [Candidatus Lindowbacteria bacterium RIFCSPLOWO2_02_FULL_62_12]OGH61003.1 MAG: hypothetical protein A3G34_16920 [Candidatus Lindowbacteria bacterium RIFCSPLOWO2_12_FULL_62_27]
MKFGAGWERTVPGGVGLAVLAVFGWSAIRELSDLSARISGAGAVETERPRAARPAEFLADEIDTLTLKWFGGSAVRPADIVLAPVGRRRIPVPEPPPEEMAVVAEPIAETVAEVAAPEEPVEPAALFPAMKLSGIFIGGAVQSIVAEFEGTKRTLALGQDIQGWRLIDLQRSAAVFESPGGQVETVRLFASAR